MKAVAASLALVALAAGAASPALADDASEAQAARIFDAVSDNAAMLRAFLQPMPKGADLHNHLGGTPSAEDYLDLAAADGFCVADDLTLSPAPCPAEDKLSAIAANEPFEYARLVDHISTRGWQNGIGADAVSGHTQFFISFERYAALRGIPQWPLLATAIRTAAGDNVHYLELMHNPAPMMETVAQAPAELMLTTADLPARYAAEIAELAPVVPRIAATLSDQETRVNAAMGCGGDAAEPGCDVMVRYLASSFRALPPAQMFRSLILSFALADADPRYLGVNIVMPEDWPVALRDYDLHMAMFRLLAARYPDVQITMHAGELSFGQVPPADMKDHIAKAIDAGAQRIGHGVDIAHETDAFATLCHMADNDIPVEINLTSNAVILGVTGADHPIALYRAFGVPITLSTDDLGILRTDMTREYQRAASEHGLHYRDLKQVSRAGLHHAFLPGAGLWSDLPAGIVVRPCRDGLTAPACTRFTASSEKARAQVALEQDLERFERGLNDIPALNRLTGDLAQQD